MRVSLYIPQGIERDMTKSDRLSAASGKKQILIVDDHPILRRGLAHVINDQPDMVVCGEAGTPAEALTALKTLKPDLVIVDLSLGDQDGLSLIKDLKIRLREVPTLVLSMHEESLYAERALLAGAKGYIMKNSAGQKLIEALRKGLSGGIYLSEEVSAKLLRRMTEGFRDAGKSPVERLTDRELEVYQLIGRGRGTQEIATAMHVSPKTIETYRERIKDKLDLKDFQDLVRSATLWVQDSNGYPPPP